MNKHLALDAFVKLVHPIPAEAIIALTNTLVGYCWAMAKDDIARETLRQVIHNMIDEKFDSLDNSPLKQILKDAQWPPHQNN